MTWMAEPAGSCQHEVVAADLLPSGAETLRSWTATQAVGSLAVVDAKASLGEDAQGEAAVFIDVVLPAPDPVAGTWAIDDVLNLHDAIDQKARDLGLATPWHVRLLPENDVEPDPEDADD